MHIEAKVAAPPQGGTLDGHMPYAIVLESRARDLYGAKVHRRFLSPEGGRA
jgi:hypothetical protein